MGSCPARSGDLRRPLLLLDVDGVLQPVGRSVPPGFERFTTEGLGVVLSARHGLWLNERTGIFEIVGATTWGAAANAAIGSRLGLPDLAHIDLGPLPRGGTRKLTAVQHFVGARPVAWVDDELYEDAASWAAERPAPTMLRRTAASVGLTHADVLALAEFGSRL